ncbi:MAG: hypothetical protein NUV34_09080 [Sulfuricaulis sp.]|nr:hypothetical protein [Sulfuricaulis sp.]
MKILGRTGLNRQGGYVYDEQLKQLAGTRAIKVFREMRDNDAIIGAFIFMITSLIRKVKWPVTPASEDKADLELAQFLEECLHDMSQTWEDTLSDILSMLWAGWSYHEIVYKRRLGDSRDPTKRSRYDDGRIGWRKIEIRSQDSLDEWEFDDDGGIKGLWQAPPPSYEKLYIPIEKALLFRTESNKNNPEGRSLLRNSYISWYFKKRMQELEAVGMERDLVGIPVMEVPPEVMMPDAPSALKTQRDNFETMVSEIRRDEREGVVIPAEEYTSSDGTTTVKTGYKLRLLQGGGQRQIDTDKVIRRYESRIAMTVLAQFLLLGQDKVGSFSLASSSTDIFAVAISAILDSIAAVMNRYAIPRLFALNNIKVEKLPELAPGDIEKPDLEAFSKFIETMVKAGALRPGMALERHIRNMAELPDLDEDEIEEEDMPPRRPVPQEEPPEDEPKGGEEEDEIPE